VLDLLRELGVDFAQGFRIGRPDDLERFWDVDAPAARPREPRAPMPRRRRLVRESPPASAPDQP